MRTFSASDRIDMFLRQDGKCARCGRDLDAAWEADHDIPYSRGGATALWNGQALCSGCNQAKGDYDGLREWQRVAIDRYFVRPNSLQDFLLVATPGAGKTKVATEVVRRHFRAKEAEKVTIVVPTEGLKRQWSTAFDLDGIDIYRSFENQTVNFPDDWHGIAITYQQVASRPDVFAEQCRRRQTVVILDEIHHCGLDKSWGDGVRNAFDRAPWRLELSGTPFRSDNNTIPFIKYNDGVSVADFKYGYDDALRDHIVRSVEFPRGGGEMEWLAGDGESFVASFDDDLAERDAAKRLTTAIQADGEWFKGIINKAHARLIGIREEDPDAGGLVIAMTQDHAKEIATAMSRVIDVRPVVVISEDTNAQALITDFAASDSPWIVAVKMISEGIDIPRLRVAVYATNVRAPLFFNQAVGRIVRVDDSDNPTAWFYIPDDPTLREHAQTISRMRDHVLQEELGRERQIMEDGRAGILVDWFPVRSTLDDRGTILGDETVPPEEAKRARAFAEGLAGFEKMTDTALAIFLRRAGIALATESTTSPIRAPRPAGKNARVSDLRRLNNKVAARLAGVLRMDDPKPVHSALNRLIGVPTVAKMTEEQLRRRLEIAQEWLADPASFNVRV